MAERLDGIAHDELLAALGQNRVASRDVDRVFRKMVEAPYRGKVPFNHIENMDPEDFKPNSRHIEIIQWFRQYPSKFILFEDAKRRVCAVGVRIPSAKICLNYVTLYEDGGKGCTDKECYRYHICRKFIGGHCKIGPRCPCAHSFQSPHNLEQLTKQGLNSFDDDELRTIFAMSHLRICDQYNRGHCSYDDRCTRLHLCENYVRGTCDGTSCKLNHQVNNTSHSAHLLKLYALDDKPQQEVVQNVVISRKKRDSVDQSSNNLPKHRHSDNLRLLTESVKSQLDVSETTSQVSTGNLVKENFTTCQQQTEAIAQPSGAELRKLRLKKFGGEAQMVSVNSVELNNSETAVKVALLQDVDTIREDSDDDNNAGTAQVTISTSPATTAAAVRPKSAVTDLAGVSPAAEWSLKLFGGWFQLSLTDSNSIEQRFCDPHQDTVSITVDLMDFGLEANVAISFDTLTATLDCQPDENIKVKRQDVDCTVWLWYWQQNVSSWKCYTVQECEKLEASYQRNPNSYIYIGKSALYKIKFGNMTQTNTETETERKIRRRPQLTS